MSDQMMEIGCPHGAWGMTVPCPHCGMPRTVTPSQHVTNRFLSEVERGERDWPGAAASAGVDPERLAREIRSLAHLAWTSPETVREVFEMIEERAEKFIAGTTND